MAPGPPDPRGEPDRAPRRGLVISTVQARHLAGVVEVLRLCGLPGGGPPRDDDPADLQSRGGRWTDSALVRQACAQARELGCCRVQLPSNTARRDAHRFYEHLGFTPSHVGFKMPLDLRSDGAVGVLDCSVIV